MPEEEQNQNPQEPEHGQAQQQPAPNLEDIAQDVQSYRDNISKKFNSEEMYMNLVHKILDERKNFTATGEPGGKLNDNQKEEYGKAVIKATIDTFANQILGKHWGYSAQEIGDSKGKKDKLTGKSDFELKIDDYLGEGFSERWGIQVESIIKQFGDIIPTSSNQEDKRPNLLSNMLNHEASDEEKQKGLTNGPLLMYKAKIGSAIQRYAFNKVAKDEKLDLKNEAHVAALKQYLEKHLGDQAKGLQKEQYLGAYIQQVMQGYNNRE